MRRMGRRSRLKRWRRQLLRWLGIHVVGGPLLRLWAATWRIEWEDEAAVRRLVDEGDPAILCFWHNRMLPFVRTHRGSGICVLVSRHGDGEVIARMIEKAGFRTARGSSSRGGAAALRALAKAVRERHVAITPDGPRGPRYRMKPGALQLAALTGRPLVLASASAVSRWQLRSWDRFELPRPFSRIRASVRPFSQPVPEGADAETLERLRLAAERELAALTAATDRAVGHEPDPALQPAPPAAPCAP
ncbi:MAG: DUF374 domain-containing protein [Planctomycetota bacterium]|nr:MAG: DUF374 domain-containing protein [Planctomycetota bacterium]